MVVAMVVLEGTLLASHNYRKFNTCQTAHHDASKVQHDVDDTHQDHGMGEVCSCLPPGF